MNETTLETLLEAFDNLPDLVFNYLNDADPGTTNPQITFVVSSRTRSSTCSCSLALLYADMQVLWQHAEMPGPSLLEPCSPLP
jgi:hypothetical protein